MIKKHIISTYINFSRFSGWWREGIVCVGKKPNPEKTHMVG